MMMRVTAQHPLLTLDKRTPVWQVSAQEGIRRPRDPEGGVLTTGQLGEGRDARRMVPRLRVSYWDDWAEMRTSWGVGFRVKVREGGCVGRWIQQSLRCCSLGPRVPCGESVLSWCSHLLGPLTADCRSTHTPVLWLSVTGVSAGCRPLGPGLQPSALPLRPGPELLGLACGLFVCSFLGCHLGRVSPWYSYVRCPGDLILCWLQL